ncbi:MAG TPA: type II toxin-antitoxin system VapC family toxin [Arachnia sp.]|nr:type II toxin-antitoxin system VapC family toxin [Propionibacteriaceae bacterium]HOA26872.1 type II toxin-antitoxin system VapC family toxin [Arachnia sp.]HQD20945.1 type II toxin-antitoxin system VapC family toxin [Arachnia sp.]
MYLVDTNVIGEARKGARADPGVRAFLTECASGAERVYLSAVTMGELRRGVELVRHRGDVAQATVLEAWLGDVLSEFADAILPVDADVAQLWGRLRAPHHENALDKQIAATALLYDLTLVTRNTADFAGTGARLFDPFR